MNYVSIVFIHLFSPKHDICCSLKTVYDGLTARIQVIIFCFYDTVVDIHGRNWQLVALTQLIQSVNSCHALLDYSFQKLEYCWVLLDHNMSGVSTIIKDHVWLPGFEGDGFINAPPKILLIFTPPSKDRNTSLCQSSCYLILCAVDIAGRPPDMGPQGDQGFHHDSCLSVDVGTNHNLGTFQRFVLLGFVS